MSEQQFSQSLEDYLETILIQIAQSADRSARVSDIANTLNVKKPSVVRAIEELKLHSLVKHKPYGKIFLTAKGEKYAEKVYQRHKLLLRFFHEILGVSYKIAERDACTIEHHISVESLEKLREFIANYQNQ